MSRNTKAEYKERRKAFFPIVAITKPIRNNRKKIGRNELCPCGSGKKFKVCHLR